MKTRTVLNRDFKKSFFLLMTVCILLALLQSCSKDSEVAPLLPEANFELVVNNEYQRIISLKNNSVNATSYLWDFGDGTTSASEENSFTHTYAKVGEYEVTLTAYSEGGENTYSKEIELVTLERYKDDIFNQLAYSEGSYGSFSENKFEFIEATGDTEMLRPLILLSPGGNFTSFTRKEELRAMLENLAKKGYVGAIVEYSQVQGGVGGDLSDFSDLFVKGVRDQRAAIRYFRSNAEKHGVDPNKIYIGGWSTGASLAFATAYMQEDDAAAISDIKVANAISTSLEKFGGLDNGDSQGISSQANGAFIIMGYTLDTSMLDPDIPLLMINHEKAVTVSDCQSMIGEISINFADGPIKVYGTNYIFEYAKQEGLTNGEDLQYILQNNWESGWKECDWYPNVSTMSSNNYPAVTDFFFNIQ